MKTLFFVSAMYFLFANAANASSNRAVIAFNQPNTKKIADTASLNGQWFLQPVLASDTAAGKFPALQINLAAGTFSGNTGCNTMRGSFIKTDSSFVFNQNIITTKMNCTGYDEAAFLKSLLRTNRYKIEKGIMILMFDETELSRWTRKPDRRIKIKTT